MRAAASLAALAVLSFAAGARAADAPPPVEGPPQQAAPPGPAAAPPAPAPPAPMPPAGVPAAPPPGAQPGYPAPYGYGAPPPYYPPPPPYYAPGAVYPYGYGPVQPRPATLDYEEGDPVPPGYRVKTRIRKKLAIAGAATFGGAFVLSALFSGMLSSANNSRSDEFGWLSVPLAGPFITIGTAHSQDAGTAWLLVDGVTQAVGATLLVAGLASHEKYLERDPFVAKTSKLPTVAVGPGSARLRWQF